MTLKSFIISAQVRNIMKIILILTTGLVMVILVAGCTSNTPSLHQNTPSNVTIGTTAIPATSEITQMVTISSQQTVSPPISQKTLYSNNDVNNHFVDIAFGPDYSSITKWNKELVHVAITGNYDSTDIKTINDFLRLFNSYSSTTKLPEEVHQGEALGDIVLNFLPESSLNNINTDSSWKISKNPETARQSSSIKSTRFKMVRTLTPYISIQI